MRAPRLGLALPLVLSLFLAGCGGSKPLDLPNGCNPLNGPKECFLPFPSDFFRADDGTIAFKGAAKIHNAMGLSADPTDWRPMNGFSRLGVIGFTMQTAVKKTKLTSIFDPPDQSTSPMTSATLLLRADTEKIVAHYVDLDPLAADPAHQAILISPQVKLDESARYIVLVHGLVGPDDKPIPAPEGFRRLRDGDASSDPALSKLASRYEKDIFPAAVKAGVARKDLQLAWDFTTGADEPAVHDMLHMRQLVMDANRASPPTVTIDAVEEPNDPTMHIWRIVRGSIKGPRIVDSTMLPTGSLVRGGDGEIQIAGTLDFPFVAVLPDSVRTGGPARLLTYGHGFFGTKHEAEDAAPVTIADNLRMVIFAIDWWGMTDQDRFVVLDGLVNSPSKLLAFTEGVPQAMANWLTAYEAIPSALAQEAAFHRSTGELIYDPAQQFFLGISQGSILGGVLASMTPLKRIALNVGGGSWLQMMFRANPFLPFLDIMSYSLKDPLDRQKFTLSLARHFDRIDPAIYARYVFDEPLMGSPTDRRLLIQIGIGDTSVPNVASFLHARSVGAGYTTPSAMDVWGLQAYDGSQKAALTVFDFGIDTSFELDRRPPLMQSQVHEGVRRLASCQKQLDLFFHDDAVMVVNPCDGPCRAP